ncbi:MAG TPA: DedA family protein [Bryobacteraceae bacterium]
MHSVLDLLLQYRYFGLFCLLCLGIVGLPIPDETLLVFAGYLILRGILDPWLAFITALAATMLGISISYAVGRALGYRVVPRFGKYVHLTPKRMERVNQWFSRMGAWLLTICYFIPGVRHFAALVAGMSRLRYRTFALFAYPGAVIWVAIFLAAGYFLGAQWERASATVQHDVLIGVGAACVAALLGWAIHKFRRRLRFTLKA